MQHQSKVEIQNASKRLLTVKQSGAALQTRTIESRPELVYS
jgi:hypothetical protein